MTGGSLVGLVLPGPASGEFQLEREAEEGSDQDDDRENADAAVGQIDGDRVDDVSSDEQFQPHQDPADHACAGSLEHFMPGRATQQLVAGIEEGVEGQRRDQADAEQFERTRAPFSECLGGFADVQVGQGGCEQDSSPSKAEIDGLAARIARPQFYEWRL